MSRSGIAWSTITRFLSFIAILLKHDGVKVGRTTVKLLCLVPKFLHLLQVKFSNPLKIQRAGVYWRPNVDEAQELRYEAAFRGLVTGKLLFCR